MILELVALVMPCIAIYVAVFGQRQLPKNAKIPDISEPALPRSLVNERLPSTKPYDFIVVNNLFGSALLARCGYRILSLNRRVNAFADRAFCFDDFEPISDASKHMLDSVTDIQWRRSTPPPTSIDLRAWNDMCLDPPECSVDDAILECTNHDNYAAHELRTYLQFDGGESMSDASAYWLRISNGWMPSGPNSPTSLIDTAMTNLVTSHGGSVMTDMERVPNFGNELPVFYCSQEPEVLKRTYVGLHTTREESQLPPHAVHLSNGCVDFCSARDPTYRKLYPHKSAAIVDGMAEDDAVEAVRLLTSARILYVHSEYAPLSDYENYLEQGKSMAMKALNYNFFDRLMGRDICEEINNL